MKMTWISVAKTWLCVTGVLVVSLYCIKTQFTDSPRDRKRAEAAASRISRQGTISEYKSKNRHSSAIEKTTRAKAVVVNVPKYISNPIYPRFTNALSRLTAEYAAMTESGGVVLTNGFVLGLKDGKPNIKFPEAYGNVVIGGVAMGDVLKDWTASVCRKRIDGTDQEKVNEVSLHSCCKHLDEPEFYCADVTYSVLPATKQVDSVQMHGNLVIGNTSKAQDMIKEIDKWMTDDFGAVDQRVATPAGTLALKKYKIGEGMNVEVKVNWKSQRTDEGCDADININFITGELAEENRRQRQELGQATDVARDCLLSNTGINYFSVKPTVSADAVAKKVVY